MRKLLVSLIALGLVAPAVVSARQAAGASPTLKASWKCTPPNPTNAIPVPDQPNHAFVVQQGNCTPTMSDAVEGVKHKDGIAVEFVEATGSKGKGRGIFTATMVNGDKIVYSYTFTGTMANNKFESGSSTYTVVSGTGKFKGITGKGTCAAKGSPDGSATHDCSGTYAFPKPAK